MGSGPLPGQSFGWKGWNWLLGIGGRQLLAHWAILPTASVSSSERDGSGAQPDDVVDLDAAATQLIVDWYAISDAALRMLDPDQQPILWPEHFDVAILLDNRSYGSSPGDDFYSAPYAYVSARDHDAGPFWNAPFGALRDAGDFASAPDLVAFWREGRALLSGG